MRRYWGLQGTHITTAALVLVVGPAYTAFGYNQAVFGNVLTLPSFVPEFPAIDTVDAKGSQAQHNSTLQGTVVAPFVLGSAIGAMTCIKIGDWLGRRKTIFLANSVAIVGAILMASSTTLVQLVVSRIVLAIGSGGYTATIPVWQSEISGAEHRGAFVNAEGIFLGLGIVAALSLDLGLYFVPHNSVSWRFPFAFDIILLLVVVATIFTFPESHRWLVKKGRLQDAREVLAVLKDVPIDDESIQNDMEMMQQSLAASAKNKSSVRNLLRMGNQRILNRAVIAILGQFFQDICGVSLTVAYATVIYEQYLGFEAVKSRGLAIAMESLLIFGGALTMMLVDRLGRRPLMLFSATCMSLCFAIVAGTTSVPNNTGTLYAATVFLFLYTPVFAVGFLSNTNLYATEVAPLEYRAAIAGTSTAASWLADFMVVLVTPVGFDNIVYRYWIVYAVINAAIVPIVFFFFSETKDLSLEEMDQVFGQSKNISDPPRIARTMTKGKHLMPTKTEEGKDRSKGTAGRLAPAQGEPWAPI